MTARIARWWRSRTFEQLCWLCAALGLAECVLSIAAGLVFAAAMGVLHG